MDTVRSATYIFKKWMLGSIYIVFFSQNWIKYPYVCNNDSSEENLTTTISPTYKNFQNPELHLSRKRKMQTKNLKH